jgi:hypothetical protein
MSSPRSTAVDQIAGETLMILVIDQLLVVGDCELVRVKKFRVRQRESSWI